MTSPSGPPQPYQKLISTFSPLGDSDAGVEADGDSDCDAGCDADGDSLALLPLLEHADMMPTIIAMMAARAINDLLFMDYPPKIIVDNLTAAVVLSLNAVSYLLANVDPPSAFEG
jgi:hypothetical protein